MLQIEATDYDKKEAWLDMGEMTPGSTASIDMGEVNKAVFFLQTLLSHFFPHATFKYVFITRTGSNCDYSVLPVLSSYDEYGGNRDALIAALAEMATFAFGGGAECWRRNEVYQTVRKNYEVPKYVGWDSLAALAAGKHAVSNINPTCRLMQGWMTTLLHPDMVLTRS